ncbi:aspartyl-tRNA(Asn)/glutamyl-tRNA(Gln) amidotransferase subunit A [Kaistia soli DSM 19436]|uniref:Aspartyl-tRNA(Asn)/glutamyl-tRNA(Gln) amidotransferase subunit A n=1 Tax=Kaistia soli DSM 19436 TaxID=1122133 RepID=A0A1M4U1J4_9HYPH|nr:amidase [Kaistia soli]SHE50608.1 aspartyl-tRNA(Asn)/glutamyl-tRNA(Gln) amidotransferase subunit A [Kaistia soli DSM 19436]
MNAPASPKSAAEIDVTELTIGEIQQGFADGLYTSEALTRAHLARIDRYEPFYNAFTFMNPSALADARAIDARRAAGEALGPLAGVPVVVKEAMDFVGLPSTGGWAPLSSVAGGIDLMPERDAPVVARLRASGAVILGKTNIPAFSHDGARANTSWDGPTFNAVDRAVAPGASSSGTATAISGSFAVVGLAEETGGSIQNPAAAQSLVSVKPTFALVPNAGVTPLAGSTRDVVGPHARTVTDAALLLDVLAGYTVEDPKTVACIGKIPAGGFTSRLATDALKGKRIGLYGTGWRRQPLSDEAAALYADACAELADRGAILVDDPFSGSGFADLAVWKSGGFDERGLETIAYDMALYLKRLGPSAAAHTLAELTTLTGEDPFAPGGILAMHAAMPVLAASLADPSTIPDVGPFLAVREAYLKIVNSVMSSHALDALAFPQSSATPPGIFDEAPYPATTVSEINIAGLPGVTVPAGRFADGAPFSLIFVGAMWSEAELLAYAYDYEQATQHRIVPTLVETPFQTALREMAEESA